MNDWNMNEDNCKLKSFAVGIVVGVAIVLLLAWDKIIYIE
jgi:hypothetical protein